MVATVNEGTASPAQIDGIEVAGKTGTAQTGVDRQAAVRLVRRFAPADDPQVAVAVMIESGRVTVPTRSPAERWAVRSPRP